MHILIALFILWFLWRFIAALIKQARNANMALNIIQNKANLDRLTEELTVSFWQAADRYDRIDILTAEVPFYLSLITGKPVQYWEKRGTKNAKAIEKMEKMLYNDPDNLRNFLAEIDKVFNLSPRQHPVGS
jgi:hypothetical protein